MQVGPIYPFYSCKIRVFLLGLHQSNFYYYFSLEKLVFIFTTISRDKKAAAFGERQISKKKVNPRPSNVMRKSIF